MVPLRCKAHGNIQPPMFLLQQIHGHVKLIHELVDKVLIIHQVPLPSGVLVALIVASPANRVEIIYSCHGLSRFA